MVTSDSGSASPRTRILVCGAGSAGLLAALTLQHKNPQHEVAVLRDRAVPVIGVGESTFGSFPRNLIQDLGIDFEAFKSEVIPVAKYGLWLAFGPEDFHYSFQNTFDARDPAKPYPEGFYVRRPYGHNEFSRKMIACEDPFDARPQTGLHLENRRFLAHLERLCGLRGIPIHDEAIRTVERDGDDVRSVNGRHRADLFVDCTGFHARLTAQEWVSFGDCLLNDRAIFLWRENRGPIRPYTKASTMPNGWLWEIDHFDGCGIGYVYSSAFVSDEAALAELAREIGPFERHRLIPFDPGTRRRHWVGNVVSIGNSDGFVEPLESTTLSLVVRCAIDVAEVLSNRFDRSDLVRLYNENVDTLYANVRDFILLHFVLNRRLSTDYWRACRELEGKLTKGGITEFLLEYYRRNGPSLKFLERMYTRYNFFGVEGYYTLFKGLGVETDVEPVLRETSGPPR